MNNRSILIFIFNNFRDILTWNYKNLMTTFTCNFSKALSLNVYKNVHKINTNIRNF